MAVAEHIANAGKSVRTSDASANGHVGQANNTTVTLKPTHFAVLCHLGLVSFVGLSILANPAHADIIADQTAAANQRPVIINAPNGVPLVNIQTPSAAGVSRNTYSQFNVNTKGAILNNSRTNVQTQLGGWVQGNPYLATGSARIILNEVNSHNPSLLNGYVEVAGSRAQVVIANPAGISCNGCGFINASRTTLTTGTPIINNGDLMGYRVGGGAINFLGAGLDTANSNYTDIIARAVNVNAGLWAQDLNIITGSNQVNVASNGNVPSITPINPDATLPDGSGNPPPAFAVDVAALGGMYAGKIHMIGTEAGVGVRNAGNIGASAGEVAIDVDGMLTNSQRISSATQTNINAGSISNTGGTITAGQQLDIAANNLTGDGKLLSGGDVTVTLSSDYTQTSTGELQANGNLTFTTTGNLTNQSSLLAGNTLTLNAVNIDNTATAEIIGLNTQFTASNKLTNRGVIDGDNTFITTDVLNNIGTGSIFGDHIAIAANTLNNLDETVNSINTAAVIAARNRLDIGALTINNQNNALMFSAGEMAIGGALDVNHQATGTATTLNNAGATIESLGNLSLNVAQINNTNTNFTTQDVSVVNGLLMDEYQTSSSSTRYTPGQVYFIWDKAPGTEFHPPGTYGFEYGVNNGFHADNSNNYYYLVTPAGTASHFYIYTFTRNVTETQVLTTAPAKITSGGAMTLTANNLTNQDSEIIAGGNLTSNVTTLNNAATSGNRIVTDNGYFHYIYQDTSHDDTDQQYGAYQPAPQSTGLDLATTKYLTNTTPGSTGNTVATLTQNSISTNSLFTPSTNPQSSYLIETNPRFANYRSWLSSDYMLNALALDPTLMQKRLGDGFYEQKLIREQIGQLTGRRFLTGYASDEAQYQALMMNGVTFAQAHQLVPGVALSAAQVAQLTSDIVWLVAQTVTLADGSQTQALVPQVYARLQAGDINDAGSLLAGETLNLNVTGDAINSGSLSGRQVVNLNTDNLHNLGGRIQGQQVSINANQDINNLGGSMTAQQALTLMAGRNINIESTTQSSNNTAQSGKVAGQLGYASRTGIDRVAGLYITDAAQGILVASAGNDLNLTAAQIQNAATQGNTTLTAANDLQLNTLQTSENLSAGTAKRYVKHQITEDVGSSINTANDITLSAGNNLNLKAAQLESSQGDLALNAGSNVNITTGTADSRSEQYSKKKSSGFMSSSKKVKQNIITDSNTIASNLSAENITINAADNLNIIPVEGIPTDVPAGGITTNVDQQAGNIGAISQKSGNISVKGSNIVATQTVNLAAQNDINLESAQDLHTESHLYKKQKTGFSASSTSIGYGSSKLKTTNNSQQVTNVGSTVGSVEGDVNITSGKDTKVTGSDLIAAQDINITGRNVTLDAAYDSYANQQSMKYKQSGITLGVSAPVITAIQSAQDQAKRSSEVKDDKVQALYAIKAAQNIVKAADAVQEIANSTNPAETSEVKLSLSIGTSKASSNSTSTETVAKGSTLTAVRDINITATGNTHSEEEIPQGGEVAGNITMVGAAGNAGRDINLDAANDINLLSAANSSNQQSKNKSSSAGVGVAIGADKDGAGISIFANASSSKGKANGNGTSHTETTLKANDTLSITSGRDTTIKGAIVSGNTVIADIGTNPDTGGNLRLESEQDSANYKSKQNSISGGISYTFGAGGFGGSLSIGKQKVNSTYDSVIEQTAIQAGDGGFDINVAGNTHLKGAVIDSTLTAQQQGNNQLTTQTLTTENIKNKGEYTANSSSVGVSMSGSPETGTNKPANGTAGSTLKGGLSGGGGTDSGEAEGTTQSAIANATITITDEEKQKALTGKTAAETVATLNRDTQHANGSIENPYDQQKVAEQLEFLQLASEVILQPVAAQAAKWIGDTFPADPSDPTKINVGKILAHATLGAAMSQLLGTGWETGAAAGALGDILPNILSKEFEKDPITGKPKNEAAFKAANAIISAALISATGADLAQTINAGMITQNAVANNYLKHQEIKVGKQALVQCQTPECKTNVTKALQSLDAEREEQKVRAEYLAKSAYDMEVRGCEGDSACIAKYQSIRYQAEDYLHDIYVQYVNGEISDEKFSGGMQVAFTLAAQGAGEHFTGLKDLTWEQVQQGLVASYASVKNTVTAEVPAFEIEKSFGEFVANAQTDKAIGGLAFDAALGSVVGYAGGKVVGWTAEKGWKALAPVAAKQAEEFLQSQGLILNAVPEGPRTYIRPSANEEEVRSLTRENEGADILANNGYKVEQNPVVNSSKDPDYRINGEIYDHYAPSGNKPRNIWDAVRDKVVEQKQADNIVINLADSTVNINALKLQFANNPIPGLKDLIVIDKHGEIIKFKVK